MRFRIKSGQSAHRFVFDRTPALSLIHISEPTRP